MSKSPSSVDFSSLAQLLAVSSASSISCCGVLTYSCKQEINFYKTMIIIEIEFFIIYIRHNNMSKFLTKFGPELNKHFKN